MPHLNASHSLSLAIALLVASAFALTPLRLGAQDFDGDGVLDADDQDDDNDGIPDAVELQGADPLCPIGFFQLIGRQLAALDFATGEYLPIGARAPLTYNALAFNQADGQLYGTSGTQATDSEGTPVEVGDLLRVSPQTGRVVRVGPLSPGVNAVLGDAFENKIYTFKAGTLYIYDLATNTASSEQVTGSFQGSDLTIIDGIAYGLNAFGADDPLTRLTYRLSSLDVAAANPTAVRTDVTVTDPDVLALGANPTFGSSYRSDDNQLYFNSNKGGLVRVDDYTTETFEVTVVQSTAPITGSADGASCLAGAFGATADTDADTEPDLRDLDADGDGVPDYAEGYDVDGDGQALDDLEAIGGTYATNNPGSPIDNGADADGDGIPDWLDNQPTTAGYDPAQRPPFLTVGDPTFYIDDDGDGLVDVLDPTEGGTAAPVPSRGGSGPADFRDAGTLAPLPVELLAFGATANDECGVALAWSTASERDLAHFRLEAGVTAGALTPRGRVAADARGTYGATVVAEAGESYFRIVAVDLDGSETPSDVAYAPAECDGASGWLAFPNPATAGAAVEVRGGAAAAELRIYDVAGAEVSRLRFDEGGVAHVGGGLLAAGAYVLRGANGEVTSLLVR